MRLITSKVFLEHDTGSHPESRKRLECFGPINETDIPFSEAALRLVHTGQYIQQLNNACQDGGSLDQDTVVSSRSYEAAVYAVGAAILASQRNDFALVRPPGHHAYPDHASGFCLFNNIAIAAQQLVRQGKRVLILDIDGHLGDGTESFFYGTDQVLYWSLHQFPAFPHGGIEDQIGEGPGKGYTINVSLPPESADDVYLNAIGRLLPVARQFQPDIVGISAGFDAYQHDPLLNLRLSATVYYKLGKILSANFSNIFAVLEGGYNTEMLPKCVNNFICGINGEPIHFEEKPTESLIQVFDEFDMRMSGLERNLSPYWEL